MNLRHIEVFHAIRLAGSINAAADRLNVSQPALSRTLKHAESLLGFKLFDRVKQRLVPTKEAELLFAEAKDVQVALERFRTLARNLGRNPDNVLRVGFLPSLGVGLAPKVVSKLPQHWEGFKLELFTHHYDVLVKRLLALDLDLAVGFSIVETPGINSTTVGTMSLTYLETDGPGAVVDPSPMDLREIDMNSFVGLEGESPVGVFLKDAFERVGVAYEPRISVHTYSVAAACVSQGVGCAIVDEFSARFTRGVRLRPLTPPLQFTITALTAENRPISNAEDMFIKILKSACTELHQES
ncbi:LysR family transcriptional regulator [Stappia taiwanensis]|uniref:LysR family transcriptional regulator n=1 Tax=Stappia taiwanensis TaxID=992267 RepID=A0A838XTD4_9HYPH|nr:LysR family transcriptional regulator [Stappia taiwanensis]MBA4613662.1 LysR family transcriptional regulator [Stappia taiwanensis]GGE81614.1 LysR family transcriptional regulator [Stappia taiwanensis]